MAIKDLPVFTTDYGVASLVLREIPYQKVAYIRLQASCEPEKLLAECAAFCRLLGAQKLLATADPYLERYPLHTAIWQMTCLRDTLGDTDAALWPVQPETVDRFREIYNRKVAAIPNAAWMDSKDEEQMLRTGEGYFVHRGGKLIGIGRVLGGELRFLASVSPGAGADVVRALSRAATQDRLTVEVASANGKAVRLYERLGFIKVAELSTWYRVE